MVDRFVPKESEIFQLLAPRRIRNLRRVSRHDASSCPFPPANRLTRGWRTARFKVAILVLGWLAVAPGARAEPVELELVLAVDSSFSVDREEFDLQMSGLARAFRDPRVVAAIRAFGAHGIAVCLVQWADNWDHSMALDWTAIHDADSAETFARRLEQTPRLIVGASTSITGALRFAMRQFDRNEFEGRRLVIDLSGDGRHNQSTGPAVQRAMAVNMGITINGLAILNEDHQLDRYYRDHVIGGTGAFVMTADSYRDFAAAIVLKLVREISGSPLVLLPREGPPDPEPNPQHDIIISIFPNMAAAQGVTF